MAVPTSCRYLRVSLGAKRTAEFRHAQIQSQGSYGADERWSSSADGNLHSSGSARSASDFALTNPLRRPTKIGGTRESTGTSGPYSRRIRIRLPESAGPF